MPSIYPYNEHVNAKNNPRTLLVNLELMVSTLRLQLSPEMACRLLGPAVGQNWYRRLLFYRVSGGWSFEKIP